jgi:predicted permease
VRFLCRLLNLGRNLVRKQKIERQLSDELAANLDLLIEEKVRAGMSLGAARREALLEFGGVEQVKEQVRRVRSGYYIESFARDFRYAARSLFRTPGFSIVALFTLAISGGAAITVFSIADEALGRPLGFTRPEELLRIGEHSIGQGLREAHVSFPKFTRLRTEGVFDNVAAYTGEMATLRTTKGIVRVPGARVTETIFALLDVRPRHGRLPDEAEAQDAVLLTHQCWQNRFGGDEALIGQQLAINGRLHTVMGVMPEDLSRPLSEFEVIRAGVKDIDFYSPEQIARGAGYLHVIARCSAVEMPFVQAALQRVDERYRAEFPENMDARFVSEASDLTAFVTRDVRPSLQALCAAVACLFFLACLNVGCLFLTRLAAHRQELTLRAALGAEQRRIVQHLFSEIAIITAGGLGLALIAAALGTHALRLAHLPFLSLPMTALMAVRAVAFAGLLFGVTAVLLTLAATLYAGRWRPDGATIQRSPRLLRYRHLPRAFVVAQIALSLVLLLAAGLLLNTLRRVHDVKLGFDPGDVIIAEMSLPNRYAASDYATFVDNLTSSVEKLPGVERAAVVYGLPLAHDDTYILSTPLAAKVSPVRDWPTMYFRVISPSYFEAMRIPLIAGRAFSPDDAAQNPRMVVVSETTGRMLFGGADPIGQKIICGGTVQTVHEICGVVGDVRSADVTRPAGAELYFSIYQQNEPITKLVVRAASTLGNTQLLVPAINRGLQKLDPEQPELEFETMQQLVARSVANRRLLALVLAVLASLALILALVGTYGVMSFAVIERHREIGLRIALGASRGDILRLVLTRGLKLIVSGVLIGATLALAGTWYFSDLLFDVSPTDPMNFLCSSVVLVTLTLLAVYLPARRAIRIDPVVALRA